MKADIHITKRMTGKMEHMQSLSSGFSDSCYVRSNMPDSPCYGCYSIRMMKRYKNAKDRFQKNTDAMNNVLLPSVALPRINASIFRFNAHGEIDNVIHARNFLRIAKHNPRTQFTLWTHDPKKVIAAIKEEGGKPDNLILIYSSQKLNKIDKLPMHFDKVFTCYTKDYIKNNTVDINCGEKKCFDCMTCYDKDNKTVQINELMK